MKYMKEIGVTLNISTPKAMKAYVKEETRRRGYASVSEFIRHLIRRDMEAQEDAKRATRKRGKL